MTPDAELRRARPKVFRTRGALIVAAVAIRGLVTAIAILIAGLIAASYWEEARTQNLPTSWLWFVGWVVMALLVAWAICSWTHQVLGQFGRKLTLHADGITIERGSLREEFTWDQILGIRRKDRLDEQTNDYGIVVGLAHNYLAWLFGSTLRIHTTDDRTITITPFYERYDELCGRLQYEMKRRSRQQSFGPA